MHKQQFKKAVKAGFPCFIEPINKSIPLNSSPYVCSLQEFNSLFQFNKDKQTLIQNFKTSLKEISLKIGKPVAAIIGGSILCTENKKPKDLDVVVFYVKDQSVPSFTAKETNKVVIEASKIGVDLSVFPYDSNPVWTLKVAAFYCQLYRSDREKINSDKGSVIIDLFGVGATEF